MVYGSECWALCKQEEQPLHTTEIKMLRWSQGKIRKDRIINDNIRGNTKSITYQFGPDTKTTVMVWAYDAKGRDSHYKKYTKYEGDGNPTQGTSKNGMARQTERWHAHLQHQSRNGHWQKTLGCHGEKRRHHPDGRRRKRLVTVSKTVIRAYVCLILKHVLQQYISTWLRLQITWVSPRECSSRVLLGNCIIIMRSL